MSRIAVAVASLVLLQHTQADDAARIKEIKAELKKHSVRLSTTYAALESESRLRKGLAETTKLKRALIKADKELKAASVQVARNRDATTRLTEANVQLNAQLARITPGDVASNNKLVGLINTNTSQLKLLDAQRKQFAEGFSKIRAAANQAREDYVGHVLGLREIAKAVEAEYQTASTDPQIKTLVDEAAKLRGKQFKLEPTRSFQTSLKQLAKLEQTVLSESIALRKEASTFLASVVVNGKAKEMIVDSGASLIAIPWKDAKALNVKVKPSDKPIKLQLADGRLITGTLVVLDSVRVGGFTVEKVEAAVLGPEAAFAEPLLGMSYLKHFKFEIKPDESKLTLVRVGSSPPRQSKSRAK